jgi:transposase
VEGSFNKERFLNFLKDLSLLPPGTVILLDNVSFHHSLVVKDIAKQHSLVLLYTPPYSPCFNPIEGVFSIIRGLLNHERTITKNKT